MFWHSNEIVVLVLRETVLVLVVSGGMNRETSLEQKSRLARIFAMLTRMDIEFDGVQETLDEYTLGVDYEHEHRDAEHEHEEMAE